MREAAEETVFSRLTNKSTSTRKIRIGIGTDERNTWKTFGYLSVDSLLRVYSWGSRGLLKF